MAAPPGTGLCILLAPARAGTQLLGTAVQHAFGTRWLQEVFHEVYSDPAADLISEYEVSKKASFFNYRYHRLKTTPELAYPSEANQRALFVEYLESIRSRFDDTSFLLDVKYNSWHHLNDYWAYFFDSPGLVKLVREYDIPVVHLVRENTFARYCSVMLARMSGIWYSTVTVEPSHKVSIDVVDCEYRLNMTQQTTDLFNQWFEGHRVYDLSYEAMLGPDGFTPQVTNIFTEILGRPPDSPLVPQYAKVTPPLREVIANVDEVRRHFSETRYRDMVEQVLG